MELNLSGGVARLEREGSEMGRRLREAISCAAACEIGEKPEGDGDHRKRHE